MSISQFQYYNKYIESMIEKAFNGNYIPKNQHTLFIAH